MSHPRHGIVRTPDQQAARRKSKAAKRAQALVQQPVPRPVTGKRARQDQQALDVWWSARHAGASTP
jgi:hypothetical protein